MKILFLNPKVNAKQEIAQNLLKQGVAFLFPENAEDAIKMLEFHGDTIDLAIVHREGLDGKGDPGLRFIEKLKMGHQELPIILTTEAWSDFNCAEHQSGPEGVNAYLHSPFSQKELFDICEAVLGQSLITQAPVSPIEDQNSKEGFSLPILEDATDIFKKGNLKNAVPSISIKLEGFGFEPLSSETQEAVIDPAPEAVPDKPLGLDLEDRAGSDLSRGRMEIEGQQQKEIKELKIEGIEISEAPEMSPGALEVSGRAEMSSNPAPEIELESELEEKPGLEVEQISEPGLESELFPSSELALPSSSLEHSEHTAHIEIQSEPLDVDSQVAEEMPYLVPGYSKKSHPAFDPSLLFAEALGDAVVPGGAAQAPDLETFKKYLLLREQDVAVLSNQLKTTHDQLAAAEQVLKEERTKQAELTYLASEQKKKIENFEKEKGTALDRLRAEVDDLTFQLKTKTDKSRVLDSQVRETVDEMEHLKARVRIDIRKIRVREKELENRLEMTKKDSEALIGARENKIIELKRKLDVLEFNMDLLQDQYSKEKENCAKLRERLIKAAQVVRVAGGLLDSNKEARGALTEVMDEETEGEEGLKAS